MAKVVLITGASSGIGYATAALLGKNGYKVYAGARRVEKMEGLKAFGVIPLFLDVTNPDNAKEVVQYLLDQEGRIDVLFNNAGYGSYGPIENVSLEEAKAQLEVNLFGVARMSKLVLPSMREQHSGRILITSSILGRVPTYFSGWYHVSKAAVEALANELRMDVEEFGIKVSLIEPAGVKTGWSDIAREHLEASDKGTVYEERAKQVAQGYKEMYEKAGSLVNTPERVAKLVKFVIESRQPKARYQDSLLAKAAVNLGRFGSDKLIDRIMKAAMIKKD